MEELFNKNIFLDNIHYLIRKNGKKIGELESDAGVSSGYISRISKDEKAKPGIEFVMNVAEALKVSTDTLLNIKLSSITTTEEYIISFLEKLKNDTLNGKIYWETESENFLDKVSVNANDEASHPLFSAETICEDHCYEDVAIFNSSSFGKNTGFYGDSFKLRLKNGIYVYFMSLLNGNTDEIVDFFSDENFAREIWMYDPNSGSRYICDDDQKKPLGKITNSLYTAITEMEKHPKLNKELQKSIDAFMRDDLEDDGENTFTDCPF